MRQLKVALVALGTIGAVVASVFAATRFGYWKDAYVAAQQAGEASLAAYLTPMLVWAAVALVLAAGFIVLVFQYPAIRHKIDPSAPPPPKDPPPKAGRRRGKGGPSNTEALEELHAMQQRGLITPEEYQAKKEEILRRL